MPPPILSSPLLNLPTINSLLSSSAPQPPHTRIQLLSAKIHLLCNDPPPTAAWRSSAGGVVGASADGQSKGKARARPSDASQLEIMQCRLELGRAYLGMEVPDWTSAEAELGMVERDCKGMLKRLGRQKAEGEGGGVDAGKGAVVLENVGRLRVEALKEMINVEEGLGREGRAERWRKAIAEAEL